MKQKPILFSTPMVQAILEGRKTMTRRIVKFPKNWKPNDDVWDWVALKDFHPNVFKYKVGDVLWVRETWAQIVQFGTENNSLEPTFPIVYKADQKEPYGLKNRGGWKPSIFMPKSACRIFLEITDIKVERLQDISEEDAIKEGVLSVGNKWQNYFRDINGWNLTYEVDSAKGSFRSLWAKINGVESWQANPFVWAISFKQIEKPVKL